MVRLAAAVLAAVALANAAGLARGAVGTCRVYSDTLRDGSLGFCAGVISGQFYVESTTVTQEDKERLAAREVLGDPANKNDVRPLLVPLLAPSCSAQLKRTACHAFFPKCNSLPMTTYVDEATCTNAGVVAGTPLELAWDGQRCHKLFPGFHCRDTTCWNEVGSVKAFLKPGSYERRNSWEVTCPPISGLFYPTLVNLTSNPDTNIANEALGMLLNKTCVNIAGTPLTAGQTETCTKTVFTGNLMTLLGAGPNCLKTIPPFNLEVFPASNQTYNATFLNLLSALKINAALSPVCGYKYNSNTTVTCEELGDGAKCFNPSPPSHSTVERSLDVVDPSSACSPFVRSINNQSPGTQALSDTLAKLDADQQEPTLKPICLQEHKINVYKGLYFVPPTPGQAPLAQRQDAAAGGREKVWDWSWNINKCPVRAEGQTLYSNFAGATPLCRSRSGATYYNKRDCLEMQYRAKMAEMPKFASFSCRAAFNELVCGAVYMKVELKELCLVPTALGGCDDKNRFAFKFVLPRFPRKSTCEMVNVQCDDFFAANNKSNITCTDRFNVKDCLAAELNGSDPNATKPAVWGCDKNALNGARLFPDGAQVFGSISSIEVLSKILNDTAFVDKVEYFSQLLTTETTVPTISQPLYEAVPMREQFEELQGQFCECPFPLVAPDDPFGETLPGLGSCCQLPCRGTMHTPDDMALFKTLQITLNGIGVVLALFMIVTWGCFKEKHKQFMTFWISVCSFFVSLSFFLAAIYSPGATVEGTLCSDNTHANSQTDGFSVCVLQAATLIFFGSAECAWWCVQSFDLFRKLVLGQRGTDEWHLRYHLFAWSFPSASVITMLALQKLGYSQPSPYCLVNEAASTLDEWLGFYAFIALCFIAGVVMMTSVIAVIVKHASRANLAQSGSSGSKLRQRYKMYRTPMLFVLLFVFVWLNIFSFRLTVTFKEEDYKKQAIAWITCLLTNAALGIKDPATSLSAKLPNVLTNATLLDPPPGDGCRTTQGGISDASIYLVTIVVFSQSILIWSIFGVQYDNFRLYLVAMGCREASESDNKITDGSKSDNTTRNMELGNTQNNSSFYGSQGPPPSGSAYGGGASFKNVAAPRGNAPNPPSSYY
jgi:hypothetical protein